MDIPLEVAEQLVKVRYETYRRLLRDGRERNLRDALYNIWKKNRAGFLKNGGCFIAFHEFDEDILHEMQFRNWIRIVETDYSLLVWITRTGQRVLGLR